MNRYTRRNFIKRTVAATATVRFATGCRRVQTTGGNDLDRGAIDRLRARLKGRLVLPTDASYETARRVFYWNPATERRPRLIVQCAAEEDALRAVEFARRHELELAAPRRRPQSPGMGMLRRPGHRPGGNEADRRRPVAENRALRRRRAKRGGGGGGGPVRARAGPGAMSRGRRERRPPGRRTGLALRTARRFVRQPALRPG